MAEVAEDALCGRDLHSDRTAGMPEETAGRRASAALGAMLGRSANAGAP